MSTISEKAAIEAATSEAELTDAETLAVHELVGGGEQLDQAVQTVLGQRDIEPAEQPAEPPVPPEGADPTQKQLDQLEREITRHQARVRDIMGGFVTGFVPCEKCGGVGLDQPGPQPQTNDLFAVCATCQGFGDVLTGSLKQGEQTRPCPGCRGRGYLEALRSDGTPVAPDAQTGAVVVPNVEQLVPPADGQPAEQNGGATRMGTPAWMGDTTLGG